MFCVFSIKTSSPGAKTFGRTTFDRMTVSKILLTIMKLRDKNFKHLDLGCKPFAAIIVAIL